MDLNKEFKHLKNRGGGLEWVGVRLAETGWM